MYWLTNFVQVETLKKSQTTAYNISNWKELEPADMFTGALFKAFSTQFCTLFLKNSFSTIGQTSFPGWTLLNLKTNQLFNNIVFKQAINFPGNFKT